MSKSTLSLILTRLSNPALFLRIEAEEMRAKDREFPLFFHCVRARGTTQGSESSSLKPREREREKKKSQAGASEEAGGLQRRRKENSGHINHMKVKKKTTAPLDI